MNKRQQFKSVRNYGLYYGIGREKELSSYDLAILEPQGQSEKTIQVMHNSGTLVIAYVSVMEIFESYPLFKLLKDEDFITLNGLKVMNKEYETYLLDLTSKRWNAILIQQIGNLILNEGYDGIFLDTIGDIEADIFPKELKEKLLNAAVALLSNIRKLFNDIIIIQNNGLNELINHTAHIIDGLCWENPMFGDVDSSEWTKATLNKLKTISKIEEIKILMVYEENQLNDLDIKVFPYAKKIAQANNFLIYKTNSYTSISEMW